ncbi:MAG TPA: hypothetical protein PKA29_01790 [Candidatus Saccharibacteria bacterium]|jgi:hypothetical protein|nr:hypothetical protein [Candidatus Saccharibacteria bacterium]
MAGMKDLILFVKYPYTAGIIATIWLGSAIMYLIHQDLPIINVVIVNLIASSVLAILGFRGKKEI